MTIYEFDRYINGQLMAEGVTIEKAKTLDAATAAAARIASKGQKGEAPVLVLRREPAAEAHLIALLRAEYERGAEAGWNAARTSVYGICEAIEDRAVADLGKPQVSEYGTGYLQAEKSTAKHIRRAMGSFEARDDDNFLGLLTQEGR